MCNILVTQNYNLSLLKGLGRRKDSQPEETMAKERSKLLEEINKIFADNQDSKNEELMFTYRGVLYPSRLCSAKTFEALEGMEARKEDMLVATYPKCGTNWALQILNDILAAHYEDFQMPLTIPMLEFGAPEKFQQIKDQPSPRIFSTHLHYDNIPKSFIENKVKILVIFRNPKDAAVSYYHFYNKHPLLPTSSSWDDFFQKFMSGEVGWKSYFDHALVWDKHMDEVNVKIMTFEELKENLHEGVKQIADFYDFPLPEEKIQSIAEKATFQTMKSEAPQKIGAFAPVVFRKGVVGDWKTLFTEAQSQEMDAKFEECLAGTKLGTKLKYDKYCKF
ncbi:sulfotransferase 6B1 [Pogona vitticeps]